MNTRFYKNERPNKIMKHPKIVIELAKRVTAALTAAGMFLSSPGLVFASAQKLEPNKTYGFWLNSQEFHNFQDQQGHPAIPYLFVFKTKSS
jgi:hypothetical protein